MVDVRESGEYARARIPGSQNIAAQPFANRPTSRSASTRRSSSSAPAAIAPIFTPHAWRRRRGRPRRMCMQGGISAWGRAGLPVESGGEATAARLPASSRASFHGSGTIAAPGRACGRLGLGGWLLARPGRRRRLDSRGAASLLCGRRRLAHEAIGTGAVAVAASAALGLFGHARAQTVKWPCALVFAVAGVAGAVAGAAVGKAIDGEQASGAVRRSHGRRRPDDAPAAPRRHATRTCASTRETAARLLPLLGGIGVLVGFASGFFGIGGGFLIVPGLVGATAMPILNAIGSSLGVGHCLRRHHCGELCDFGPGQLVDRRAVHRRRSHRQPGRDPACTSAGFARARSVTGLRGDRHRGGSLCRLERLRGLGGAEPGRLADAAKGEVGAAAIGGSAGLTRRGSRGL